MVTKGKRTVTVRLEFVEEVEEIELIQFIKEVNRLAQSRTWLAWRDTTLVSAPPENPMRWLSRIGGRADVEDDVGDRGPES